MEMKDDERTAKAGTLLIVDSGEYSDYVVTGFFVVLREFSPGVELRGYLAANKVQEKNYRSFRDNFLATLLAKGLLLEIEYGTLHLSEHGDVSECKFTPVLEG